MKVLVLWNTIEDSIKGYLIPESLNEIALQCSGKYINTVNLSDDDPLHQLCEELDKLPYFEAEEKPLDCRDYDKIVICGFIP